MSGTPPVPLRFDTTSLEEASSIALLDDDLCIEWVNDGWARFAAENGGARQAWTPGTPYLDAISPPLRDWYRAALSSALLGAAPWHHEYECPSPELARRFRLSAYPLRPVGAHGLLLVHTPIVEQRHGDRGGAVDAYRDPSGLVHVCMHCRRTRRLDGRGWDWVADALVAPEVSHGLCGPCRAYYFGELSP